MNVLAPEVPFPRAMARFPTLRQSLLGAFDVCALETIFDAEDSYIGGLDDPDRMQWNTHPQARGQIMHRWAGRLLLTLETLKQDQLTDDVECPKCGVHPNEELIEGEVEHQEGNACPHCSTSLVRRPLTEEALDLLCDTLRQADIEPDDVVRVPQEHVKDLEWIVCKFAREQRFKIANLVSVEERLSAFLEYPNPFGGVVRRELTGQLDAVFAEEMEGGGTHVFVLDWKDTWAIPGATSISTEGYWQQRFYAWLVMRCNPSVQMVTLREVYVRFKAGDSGRDNHREATITRAKMPLIERQLAVVAESFDRAWEAFEEERDLRADFDGSPELREELAGRLAVAERRARALTKPSPGGHCFAGETRVLTEGGVFSLDDLAGARIRVLNRRGEWEDAVVRSFGMQQLVRVTFDDGSEVRVTPDHRWWKMAADHNHGWVQTEERITTAELDRVPIVRHAELPGMDEEGIRHGFVYGDGYRRRDRPSCTVRMMPQDEHMARFFTGVTRRGDGHLHAGGLPGHFKTLGGITSPSYARGFIAGLLAADGHVDANGGARIYCEGRDKAEAIAEVAWLAGAVVTSVNLCTDKPTDYSPVGTMTRELMYLQLKPATVPILRPSHAANLKARNQMRRMYREVVSIEPDGFEEVFCAVVAGSESFTLANGIATSNCNYCPKPHLCPILDDVRVHGSVHTPEDAERVAGELVVAKRVVKHRETAIKGYLARGDTARSAKVSKVTDDGEVKLTVYKDRRPGLPEGVPVKNAKGNKVMTMVEGVRRSSPSREDMEVLLENVRSGQKVDLDTVYREASSSTLRLVEEAVPTDEAAQVSPLVEEALAASLERLERMRAVS